MNKEKLAEERARRRLSMREMAEHFGVNYQTYYNWEKGRSKVPGTVNAILLREEPTPYGQKKQDLNVKVSEETYKKLSKAAAKKGHDPDSLASEVLEAMLKGLLILLAICIAKNFLQGYGNQSFTMGLGDSLRFIIALSTHILSFAYSIFTQ